jgi:hypothetical protein
MDETAERTMEMEWGRESESEADEDEDKDGRASRSCCIMGFMMCIYDSLY